MEHCATGSLDGEIFTTPEVYDNSNGNSLKLYNESFLLQTEGLQKNLMTAWCNGCTCDTFARQIGMDRELIKTQYKRFCEKTRKHITKNTENKIGGKGVVVVIDSFPLGYFKYYEDQPIDIKNHKILAIAELKDIPPKYFFEILQDTGSNHTSNDEQTMNTITTIVVPGSILVVENSLFSSANLKLLKQLYPITVTIDMLQQHDTSTQNVVSNLETVWRNVINSCDNARNIFDIENILTASMWKQLYRNDNYRMLAMILG